MNILIAILITAFVTFFLSLFCFRCFIIVHIEKKRPITIDKVKYFIITEKQVQSMINEAIAELGFKGEM